MPPEAGRDEETRLPPQPPEGAALPTPWFQPRDTCVGLLTSDLKELSLSWPSTVLVGSCHTEPSFLLNVCCPVQRFISPRFPLATKQENHGLYRKSI